MLLVDGMRRVQQRLGSMSVKKEGCCRRLQRRIGEVRGGGGEVDVDVQCDMVMCGSSEASVQCDVSNAETNEASVI